MNSVAFEEQSLAYQGRKRRRLIRLGHQEGRLGSIAGQIALRIGGDEDHRHLEQIEEVIDGIEAGTAVGELDVGEDQSRPAAARDRRNACRGFAVIWLR